MRVLIYSSIRLFSESLADSLLSQEHISEVSVCHEVTGLVLAASEKKVDIVLIDMLNQQALNEASRFSERLPSVCLLALGVPETPEQVIACADAGFLAYVPISASIDVLCARMRLALEGACQCHPKVAAGLMRELSRRRPADVTPISSNDLTPREEQVLSIAGRGLSNKEIARELNLSSATIKNHLHNIFAKLGVNNRAEALASLKNRVDTLYVEKRYPQSRGVS